MRRILFLLLLLLLLLNTTVYSYDWLYVRDPQRWWISGQGSIDLAQITVRPRGIYMEYGLYLTFSAKGLGYGRSDTLEVEFQFDLPQNAIVHDSWLWIGDSIIRGKIMDKWTAESIYENIVNRRRDPSVLYKRSATHYEMRIFPMAGDESRKVKITYLAPTEWNVQNVLAPLPTSLFRTSKTALPKFHLMTWLDNQWTNPRLLEYPNISFTSQTDTVFGEYVQAVVPSTAFQSSLNFAVSSPLESGVFLSRFGAGSEGLYQLVFLPSRALNLSTPQKVAVLFDYDASKSSVTKTEILQTVKNQLQSNFTAADSFNLIFSQLNIRRASDRWIAADSAIIENTFYSLGTDPIASYSNLPALLANAVNFIKSNGGAGALLLVSNTDHVGDSQAGNQLLNDLLALMNPIIPLHVVDFQNMNYTYYWIGGRSYIGNEYFYTNVTRQTAGNYFNIRGGLSFATLVTQGFQSMSPFVTSFDLHTKLQNGYCFGRYNFDAGGQTVLLNRPVMQIGKYNGTFPFVIEASGVYLSTPFTERIEVGPNDAWPGDSVVEEMWSGRYIQSMESQVQSNSIVSAIIDESTRERVLSLYTAFLCLEPSRGGEVCYDCLDESELVGVEESEDVLSNDSLFTAYPNPFNSQTKIKVRLPASVDQENVSFRIYNILGQVVRTFTPPSSSGRVDAEFVWDGRNDNGVSVSSGMYLFVVSTPVKHYTLKLLLTL